MLHCIKFLNFSDRKEEYYWLTLGNYLKKIFDEYFDRTLFCKIFQNLKWTCWAGHKILRIFFSYPESSIQSKLQFTCWASCISSVTKWFINTTPIFLWFLREDPTPKVLKMFTDVHDGYFNVLVVTVRTTSESFTKRWKQNIFLETSSGKFVNVYFLTSERTVNQTENILLFPHKNAC